MYHKIMLPSIKPPYTFPKNLKIEEWLPLRVGVKVLYFLHSEKNKFSLPINRYKVRNQDG